MPRGARYGLEAGGGIRVIGVPKVIGHPPVFVGDVLVEGWVEPRVSE